MSYKVFLGDCLEVLKTKPENSIDSIVTDPPAGIAFMGKDWDKDKGGRQEWVRWMTEVMAECLRVLKPGGHALVWSIPRTAHWTATALEDAGFEVRDCITHLFGSGFPKSQNISKAIDKAAGAEREVVGKIKKTQSYGRDTPTGYGSDVDRKGIKEITSSATHEAKQWDGWGTALKPAAEFWWLVRKPLGEKTVAKNVLKHGTGGINIDGCRIEGAIPVVPNPSFNTTGEIYNMKTGVGRNGTMSRSNGRFPANLVLSHHDECVEECHEECPVKQLDGQSGPCKKGGFQRGSRMVTKGTGGEATGNVYGVYGGQDREPDKTQFEGDYGASRFFYCAKASKRDKGADNSHPTVKNTKLMEYLITLITPPNGIVLDPFMGSGSTGVAALRLGHRFFGIEAETEYYNIAKGRLDEASSENTTK